MKGIARRRRTSLQCRSAWIDPQGSSFILDALALVQLARLRLALAEHHLEQYFPGLIHEGFVSLSDLYDCPQPELEALLAEIDMKPKHAKLLRAILAKPRPPYQSESTCKLKELLVANGLSKYADYFRRVFARWCKQCAESHGHDIVQFLLEVTEKEVSDVCAPMKPVERRRFLRATEYLKLEGKKANAEATKVVSTRSHNRSTLKCCHLRRLHDVQRAASVSATEPLSVSAGLSTQPSARLSASAQTGRALFAYAAAGETEVRVACCSAAPLLCLRLLEARTDISDEPVLDAR